MTEVSASVRALIEYPGEVVPARMIAPVLGMHPSVIIRMAKTGTWDKGVCNYIVSGKRVKFFRLDFLRKNGFIK